jgi:hypothetical protein
MKGITAYMRNALTGTFIFRAPPAKGRGCVEGAQALAQATFNIGGTSGAPPEFNDRRWLRFPPYPRSWRRFLGLPFPHGGPTFYERSLSGGTFVASAKLRKRTRRCAMPPQEIGVDKRTEEIDWRHVWLKSVLIDGGNLFPTKIHRHGVARRMSAARRLEKLHRMRATLEPARSWMAS